MLPDDSEHMFACRENRLSFQNPNTNFEIGFACQKDYSLALSKATVNIENNNHLWAPDSSVPFAEDQFLENALTIETPNEHVDCTLLNPRWDDTDLEVDANMSRGLTVAELSTDCFETFDDVAECSRSRKKFSMRSCSFMRNMQSDRALSVNGEGFEFQIDGLRTKKKWPGHDYRADIGEAYNDNQRIEPCVQDDVYMGSTKSLPIVGDCFGEESDITTYSVPQIQKIGSTHRSSDSEFGSFINEDVLEGCLKYDRCDKYDYFADTEVRHCSLSSSRDFSRGLDDIFKGDTFEFNGHNLDDILFPKGSDETDWLGLDVYGKDYDNTRAAPSHYLSSLTHFDEDENRKARIRYRDRTYNCEKRQRRSCSAPPFYGGKKKFFGLTNCSTVGVEKPHFGLINDASAFQETSNLKNGPKLCGEHRLSPKPGSLNGSLYYARPHMKRASDNSEIQNCDMLVEGQCLSNMISQDLKSKDTEDLSVSGMKWRNSSPRSATGNKLRNEDTSILDVSSGILHLAGDSLVPKSISKNCLKDAKVLQQIDRKFIPVVAGGILAIIDQHAADERIRLEELRHKVLSGEMKTITYLDAEQELVLPEMGYQLLQNYAEQVQNWGWICNIHSQNSRSFRRNLNLLHRQPSVTTLVAVPCILGVSLTDADLLEFLQQLSDTDGSSAIPPSVLRILNSKACRGAIMFGDRLLPSECSLIVEELKQTSLCFQCAHGRPTTVTLVNLDSLHKQIAKLCSWSSGSGSNESWHGLHRHKVSLERAAQRLRSAGVHC